MPEFIVAGLNPNFVSYESGLLLQQEVHASVAKGERQDTVILLEHEPVYTAGKRTEALELPQDGTPVVETNRGGKITWHGPGQLVGYPIMKLPLPIDVVGYVRWLEQVLISAMADLGIKTERVEGRSGVWVKTSDTHSKVAAIGIRVAEHTTMHGFALNCNNSLEPFENIVACGISDAGTTTISQLLGREFTPAEAIPLIEKHLGSIEKVAL